MAIRLGDWHQQPCIGGYGQGGERREGRLHHTCSSDRLVKRMAKNKLIISVAVAG